MSSGPIILSLLVFIIFALCGWYLYHKEQNGNVGDLRIVLRDGVYSIEEKIWSVFEEKEIWCSVVGYTVEEVERGIPSLEELKGECVRRHHERRVREEAEQKKLERRVVHFEKFKKNRHGR